MANFPADLREEMGGPGVDWFDTIHLLPRAGINFGSIATQTDEPFDLFSAYRDDVSLQTFSNNAPESVSVPDLPSLPYTLSPFSSLRDPTSVALAPLGMSVRALATTQAEFTASLEFALDVGTLTLTVTGVHLGFVALEFDDEVEERLSWSTDILSKLAGTNEQRIARRENPRQSFDVKLVLDGATRRQWANLLFGAQDALFAVPLWHDRLVLTAAISVSGTSATVASTAYCDLRVGGQAALFKDDSTFDVLEIATVTSTTVTFASGAVFAYAAGDLLMPVRAATIEPLVRSSRPPFAVEKVQAHLDVTDNDTGVPAGDVSGFSSHDGRVLLDDLNVLYGSEASQSSARQVTVIDNDTGKVYRISQWDRSKHGFAIGLSPKTRAALWRVRLLLIALRGKQVSFWVPTNADDLIPTQNLTNGTATLVVENCGYTRFVNARQPRATIRVTFTDASTVIRTILTAVETSATEETLTVEANWAATKTPAQVSRIEFLELVRIDDDDIVIRHRDVGRATVQIPVMTVVET